MHTSLFSLFLATSFILRTQAAYNLVDNYNASNWFENFDFFDKADPTQGFVQYLPLAKANAKSILAGYSSSSETVFMGVDSTTKNPDKGRESIRVESKKTYTRGLFIADIKHMPASICGVWPAFWTFGENWPGEGEIDVLEGVNDQITNKVTLHTAPGCVMSKDPSTVSSSTLKTTDCGKDGGSVGCGFDTQGSNNYGTSFNQNNGGVYALEWTNSVIRVFFFPRQSIPSDIASESPNPDPSTWGQPIAAFSGSGCDLEKHFQNHKIVFNTTFCGAWAGASFDEVGECKKTGMTCVDYVKSHPEKYDEAFWELNGLRVYQQDSN